MEQKFAKLLEIWSRIADIHGAAAVLQWDQETYMPEGAAENRAKQLATLEEMAHDLLVSDEVGNLLSDLVPWSQDLERDSLEASTVRVAKREYDQAVRVPGKLVAELSEATGLGVSKWLKAKASSDFGRFQSALQKIVDLKIQEAEALGYEESLYDAFLDQFEPGVTTRQVNEIFDGVKARLIPLVKAIADRGPVVDDSVLRQGFNPGKQWDFGMEILGAMGFDFRYGRQDRAEHPATTSMTSRDVRVTTNIDPQFLLSGLLATIHEGGHALYEQGIPSDLDRTPVGRASSSGIHESQSRLWENVVGCSLEFWSGFLPRLQEFFPDALGGASLKEFYRAINKVEPSLIRIQADEVTYNLHIFLRFELEQAILTGKLALKDLPEAWNEKMNTYLGITPQRDAEGVLQDVHWSVGLFGYFPTYTLGNILSVQFYEQAVSEVPEIPKWIAEKNLIPLKEWLNSRIHTHGCKFTMPELVTKVTGKNLSITPYLDYIERKFKGIYGV